MIYYLDDDQRILDLTIYALEAVSLDARGFTHAKDFLAACEAALPDVVLLDIMLPDIDGLDVLRILRNDARSKDIPIMMLTAKGSEIDLVHGLDAGADDYLAKPFGMMELVARVKALMRRSPSSSAGTCLVKGPIALYPAARRVVVDEQEVELTRKEFELLLLLMDNAGMVLTRNRILEDIWSESFLGESRTIDVHIQTLRQKLEEAHAGAGSLIETVRGVGYRFGG